MASYTYFEIPSYLKWRAWRRAHLKDDRYSGILKTMRLIKGLDAVYQAAWSELWQSAHNTGAIRFLRGQELEECIEMITEGEA